MSKSLPDRPNLEHLRNEAKALLKAHRSGESGVCETLRHVPRLENVSDELILAVEVSLQEVQHALARAYGFRSWKELSDHVAGQSEFAGRVQEALGVFTSKGPHQDSTGSAYEQRRAAETQRLLSAGDDGFRVMMELARSDNGRARNAAAIFFGLSDDGRAPEELRRLFNDESAMVRSRALRFYAAHIHPQSRQGNVWGIGEPAETVPEGVEAMLPLVSDANVKVQLDAVSALSAYAGLDHARILEALHQALSDPKHKVQHAAARSLGVPCPKCDGGSPEPKQPSQVPVVQ